MLKYRQKIIKKISSSTDAKSFGCMYESIGRNGQHGKTFFSLKWNSVFMTIGLLSVLFLFISKLASLQIILGASYKTKSETNRISQITIRAPRGVIYDRNNVQLTNNAPSFRLMVDLDNVTEDSSQLAESLTELLGLEQGSLLELFESKQSEGESIVLVARELTRDQFLIINANIDKLDGVFIEEDVKRVYPYKEYLSHVLGYTGEATREDINTGRYKSGDILGKAGLEYQYEDILRGNDGQRSVVTDVAGNIINEQGIVPPESGGNLITTIDIEVQKKLYEFLQKGVEDSGATGAAALIGTIEDGEIVAAVSLPSYDNNLFIGGISQLDYDELISNAAKPLLNRYLGAAQPPGSTFKTITATAGLDSGAISTSTIFNSTGVFYLGGYPFQEYQRRALGPLSVVQGLAQSSNIFFYETVLKLGIDNLANYARMFGIGELTGVDLPGEIPGNFSSPEYKELVSDEIWYPGDSLNAAIGQGYNRVTPLQMLKWVTAIANGGGLFNPHFIKEYQDDSGNWHEYAVDRVDLGVSPDVLATVREGMRESVRTGVVYTLRNNSIEIAAKTGTAEFGIKDENGEYTKAHAWVMGFFPYQDPKYVFVFFQEAGGLGSTSGKVANEFINWLAEYDDSF